MRPERIQHCMRAAAATGLAMAVLAGAGWVRHAPAPRIRLVGPGDQGVDGCLSIGAELVFDVHVDSPPFAVAAAQLSVAYDPQTLQFQGLEPGENPFTELPLVELDESKGTLLWISSVPAGAEGSDASARIARMRFRAMQDDCTGVPQVAFDPAPAPVLVASGSGQSASMPLQDPAPVAIDSAPPVLVGIPPDRNVRADAATPCRATLVLVPPTAADACNGVVPVTWTRSDGAATLDAPWSCGITTVTWRAVDACGRVETGSTRVKVTPRGRRPLPPPA